jgi:hypothetical protein
MKAHVLIFLDTTTSPPTVVKAGIYSEDAGSIAVDQEREYPVEALAFDGVDYGAARHRAESYIAERMPEYQWLRDLMGAS